MGHPVPSLTEVGQKAPPDIAEMFKQQVADLLDRNSRGFPGAQPVSFNRGHLKQLRERDYYICEKSDGVRCLLWFSVGSAGQEAHYLIDRKNDYYYVDGLHYPQSAPDGSPANTEPDWASFHTDTMLDGELLFDVLPEGRVLKYLVFDCLVLDGKNLMNRTLDKRLAYFMEKVYKPYSMLCSKFPEDASYFKFKLEKKSFQFGYGTEMMFKDILPNLPHGSDGLIFTCKETPYKFGTDENILKWKPAEENTIDFKLGLEFPPRRSNDPSTNGAPNDEAHENDHDDDDDGYGSSHESDTDFLELDYDALPSCTLFTHYNHDTHQPFAPLHLEPAEWETMKAWSIEHQDGLDGQVVECHRDAEGRWRFNRFRDDKRDANHFTVVDKVLQSIQDGVTKDELIAAAPDIKREFRKRQAAEDEKRKRARDEERRKRG